MLEVPPSAWHTSQGLMSLRTMYGRATEFWAARGLRVEESRWIAMSGGSSALFNESLCHGPEGGAALLPTIEEMTAARLPATLSVAGEALRDVRRLVDMGWTCVEAQQFMALSLADLTADPAVRRLAADDVASAQLLVEDAYQLPDDLARIGLPDRAIERPGHAIWGLFVDDAIVSCMGSVIVDGAAVVWSMATPTRYQRRGFAARLLTGALAACRDEGATYGLLRSSSVGEPLYRAAGFEVLEWWQVWSRPRWVLARD
jgi:GNAT superfamily N-acetyltransferase